MPDALDHTLPDVVDAHGSAAPPELVPPYRQHARVVRSCDHGHGPTGAQRVAWRSSLYTRNPSNIFLFANKKHAVVGTLHTKRTEYGVRFVDAAKICPRSTWLRTYAQISSCAELGDHKLRLTLA